MPTTLRAGLIAGAFAASILALARPATGWTQGSDSDCQLSLNKFASPTELELGEPTTITLTVTQSCPRQVAPLHTVLAIDGSSSMRPQNKLVLAQAASIRFVDQLDLPKDKTGVVAFSDRAYVMTDLTGDRNAARDAIQAIRTRFGTDTVAGLESSQRLLDDARSALPPGAPRPIDVIVILSDGRPFPGGPAEVRRAADAAKQQAILIASICVGDDCDRDLMREIASQPELFYDVPDPASLVEVYERIADQLIDLRLIRLRVYDTLPANMRYVPGSAVPVPAIEAPNALAWDFFEPVPAEFEISFQVLPQAAGRWPTNEKATADILDSAGRFGSATFPVPEVVVRLAPTPSPSPTVTPTPTLTPLPSTTPVPQPVFLPIALRERCDPRAETLDVVLVLDLSRSMEAPTRDGGMQKREAARRAAIAFVGELDLQKQSGPHDQVAIVGFNREAAVLSPLGADRGRSLAALVSLPRGSGTRIDLGVDLARQIMRGPERIPGNRPVILLLTDGRPSEGEEGPVRRSAALALSEGLDLYTVGLGSDVNSPLLLEITGQPDRYFEAAQAEELEGLYQRLASLIPCPRGRHDWGKPWP